MPNAIKYGFDRAGGFWALDLDARIAVYAYTTSPNEKTASKYDELDDDSRLERHVRSMLKQDAEWRNKYGDASGHFEAAYQRMLKMAVHAIVTGPVQA